MRITRASGKPPENDECVAVGIGSLKSVEEARLAMRLTEDAIKKGKNIANKKKLEFLLWLSGTRDIKNALKKTKPGKEFYLIEFDGKEEYELPEKAEPLGLERISLSRI